MEDILICLSDIYHMLYLGKHQDICIWFDKMTFSDDKTILYLHKDNSLITYILIENYTYEYKDIRK